MSLRLRGWGVALYAAVVVALAIPASAAAHAYLVRTVAVGERRRQHPTRAGLAHLRRGGRAALRDHLGDRRRRASGDVGLAAAIAVRPGHARRAAEEDPGGVVPRLLAGDLGRRASRPRCVHVRRRAEPGTATAIRDPVDRRERGDAEAGHRARDHLPVGHVCDRPLRVSDRDRTACHAARRGDEPARCDDRVRRRRCGRPVGDARLPRHRHGGVLVTVGVRPRHARAADARIRVRTRLPRPRALLRAVRRSQRGLRSGSTSPTRPQRSVAELLATIGALAAAATVLIVPGAAGHAAQTAPRGLSLAFDWLHLVSGSVWVGGLVGILVLWSYLPAARRVAGLAVAVPRFSNTALVAVTCLLGTGIGATVIHMPTLAALWQTVLRQGDPRQGRAAGRGDDARGRQPRAHEAAPARRAAARRARRRRSAARCAGSSAVRSCSCGAQSSRPRCSRASRRRRRRSRWKAARAREGGPGPVAATVTKNGYTLKVLVSPNRAAFPNDFALELSRNGTPVTGATVTVTFAMLDMEMGTQEYRFDRDEARRLLAPVDAGARDGRPLGTVVPGEPARWAVVHGPRRRPDEWMSGLRPLGAPFSAVDRWQQSR